MQNFLFVCWNNMCQRLFLHSFTGGSTHVGSPDGSGEGSADGRGDGRCVGAAVGAGVGGIEGRPVGSSEGSRDGAGVGMASCCEEYPDGIAKISTPLTNARVDGLMV